MLIDCIYVQRGKSTEPYSSCSYKNTVKFITVFTELSGLVFYLQILCLENILTSFYVFIKLYEFLFFN